jgi:hypothetical protein
MLVILRDMTNFVQTNICEVSDSDFQLMISELCGCVNLYRDDVAKQPMAYLLTAIVREKKKMSLDYIPFTRVLELKVGKLEALIANWQEMKSTSD